MRDWHYTFIIVIFFLIPYSKVSGSEINNFEKQFGFAESLFNEGDYFRAIGEYKRFNFYYTHEEKLVEKSYWRIGESYYKAGRWTEAVDAFSVFNAKYKNSPMFIESQYLKGLAEKHLKRFEDSFTTFNSIIEDKSSSKYYDRAIYQIALIRLDRGEWQEAKKTLLLIQKESPLFLTANSISNELENIEDIPHKSPVIAGILAAVIPGAGHLYTERPRDALVSFLLNGSFIWAASEQFKHGNNITGMIVVFFELGWYSGNIYSAISSAHKFNSRTQEEFIQALKNKSPISYYYDSQSNSNYLMLSVRY